MNKTNPSGTETLNELNQKLLFVVISLSVAMVFYFSWLPDPTFKTEEYIPLWLQQWSSTNYNLRTAIPFVFLAFIIELFFLLRLKETRFSARFQTSVATVCSCIFIVCFAEAGQYFTATRTPDVMDVFFGLFGSAIGMGLFYGSEAFVTVAFKKHA